jgi:hypothetical protein
MPTASLSVIHRRRMGALAAPGVSAVPALSGLEQPTRLREERPLRRRP